MVIKTDSQLEKVQRIIRYCGILRHKWGIYKKPPSPRAPESLWKKSGRTLRASCGGWIQGKQCFQETVKQLHIWIHSSYYTMQKNCENLSHISQYGDRSDILGQGVVVIDSFWEEEHHFALKILPLLGQPFTSDRPHN